MIKLCSLKENFGYDGLVKIYFGFVNLVVQKFIFQ